MVDNALKFRSGLLVAGGAVLTVILLIALGMGRDWFTPNVEMVTLFTESVQGLSVGSGVKYKGVQIGTVNRVEILVDDQHIRVGMKINLEVFVRRDAVQSQAERIRLFREFIRKEIEKGLRCRLEYAGITGLRYIEFDYYGPLQRGTNIVDPSPVGDRVYIGSVPSVFKDMMGTLATSLDKISKIRFEEISDNVNRALGEITRMLAEPEIKSAMRHLEEMAVNLDKSAATISRVVTEERLTRILALLDADLAGIQRLTERLDSEVKRSEFAASTKEFREAAKALRTAAQAVTASRADFKPLLVNFERTLDSLTALTDFLRDDPSSLIRGKSAPSLFR